MEMVVFVALYSLLQHLSVREQMVLCAAVLVGIAIIAICMFLFVLIVNVLDQLRVRRNHIKGLIERQADELHRRRRVSDLRAKGYIISDNGRVGPIATMEVFERVERERGQK